MGLSGLSGVTGLGGITSSYQTVVLPTRLLVSGVSPTLYEGFETTTGWTPASGTIANDSVYKVQGNQSILFTPNTGASMTAIETVSWVNLSTMTTNVRLWGYLAALPKPSDIVLYMGAAGLTKRAQITLQCVLGQIVYNLIQSDWEIKNGFLWTDGAQRFQVRTEAASGEQPAENLDNFVFSSSLIGQGAVLVTFDDGKASVYASAYPIMAAHGIRGTAYVITNDIGTVGCMTVAQIQTLSGVGWCIGNHTSDHTDLTSVSEAVAETKLSTAANALLGWGLSRGAYHVAYPYGYYNADVFTAMAATGMLTGRTVYTTYNNVYPLYTPYRIHCKTVTNTTSVATAEGYIDRAKNAGEVLVLLFHDIGGTGNMSVADFTTLMAYLAASGLPVLTAPELLALDTGPVSVPALV